MNIDKAIAELLDKLNIWLTTLIRALPNILLASIILVVGLYIARVIRRFANKKFKRFFPTETLGNLTINFVYVFCIGIVLFVTLKVLKLDRTIMTVLGAAGIIGIGLAFAFQDIAANFISGVFLAFNKPFKVNDLITTNDLEGFVVEVKLRDTTIRTHQGHLITIPNRSLFQNPIINYTRYGKRRADIVVGVSYGDDLKKAQEVALRALKNVPNVIADDTTVFYEEFADSAINFRIRIWVNSAKFADYLHFINDVIIILKEAFDKNEIVIPFPIRTLDFDAKGGKNLSDLEMKIVAENKDRFNE